MKIKIVFLFSSIIISAIFTTNIIAGELTDKAELVIKNSFGSEANINSYRLDITKNLKFNSEKFSLQRFFGNFIYYYEIKENETLVGYAILDNVLGKVKPITFLILFNVDKTVKLVEIIKYREEHGGAVKNREWLSQFVSKSIDSDFELNNGIDGISGATISVKSISKGVKRLVYLINNLGDDEKNQLVSIE